MDFPRYDQPSGTDVHPGDDNTDALKMHKNVAWAVGDEMLQLISQRNVPSGFDAAAFVKNSVVETFGSSLNQTTSCPSSERDTFAYSSKRKRCSVVDSALGTLGYDALKVCDTKAKNLIEMLTAWIQWRSSSGLVCDYLGAVEERNSSLRSRKFHGQLCAQNIPVGTVLQVVHNCKSFFATVKDDGTQVREIVDALLKLATDTCKFAPRAESVNGVCNKTIYDHDGHRRKDNLWALQSVIDFVLEHRRSIYSKLRPGSRLRVWRVRPSCLKQDISSLASEAMLRHLLPLDTELSQREELVILVVCLSMAPEMFVEARRLLHHWLLSSGALRLWELRAKLVEAVWDVANHPSAWGLTHDVHLPPKFAFYCVALRPFVQILDGPPTILGLFRLLKLLDDVEKLPHQQDDDTFEQSTSLRSCNYLDHNSMWSLLVDFFPWLVFATKLLFRSRNLKQAATSTSERHMYESLVSSGKYGRVLSGESEFDFGHVNSRVAAKYLAWIISPINRLHRDTYEEMFLSLNTSWRKFQEDFVLECCSRLSGPHDYGALKAAVQASCIKCTRCGSPVKMVTTATNEAVEAVCCKGKESLPALKLWLARLQKYFGTDVTTANSDEKMYAAREVDSRKGRSSITSSSSNSSLFLIHYLPLAALSESLTICNVETVVSLLHFVSSCGVDTAHSSESAHEGDNQSRAQILPVCKSCDALGHTEHRFSKSSESQARPTLSSKPHKTPSASGGGPQQKTRMGSPEWILGIAAVFNILNSLDVDVLLLLAGSGLPVVDPTGEKRRVTDHTAVIVAEYVIEWSRSFETVFSRTSPPSEGSVTYKTTLEDLLCRFCRWIGKLSLSSEAARICSETIEVVAMRIKNVKSSHSQ